MIKKIAAMAAMLLAASGLMAAPAAANSDFVSLTTCIEQTMMEGEEGPCVASLQNSLVVLGIVVTRDGKYGANTTMAVRGFQSGRGLPVTGIADSETIRRLDQAANSPLPEPAISTGTVSGERPNGGVHTWGTLNRGRWSETYYLNRETTIMVNDILSGNESGFGATIVSGGLCFPFSGPVGSAVCGFLGGVGEYYVTEQAENAVENDECLAIKHSTAPIGGGGIKIYTNNGPFCYTLRQ